MSSIKNSRDFPAAWSIFEPFGPIPRAFAIGAQEDGATLICRNPYESLPVWRKLPKTVECQHLKWAVQSFRASLAP